MPPFLKTAGWLLVLLCLLGGCQPDAPPAESYLTTIPDPRSLGRVYVSDPDLLLGAEVSGRLNARLDSLDRSGRAHIDVVLVNSIGEAVPKTAATALFNKWKIGRQDTNNGLLLLLVVDQHRIEMETGYGLEGDLPDAICYRIQQEYMLAPARAGDYSQAVWLGVDALIRQLAPGASLAGHRRAANLTTDSAVSAASTDNASERIGELSLAAAAARANPPADSDDLTFWRILGCLAVGACALGLYLYLAEGFLRGVKTHDYLILVPFILVIGLLILALAFRLPNTIPEFAGLCYVLPGLFLHGYFAWHLRLRQPLEPAQRVAEYLRREQAHKGLAVTAWLFPVLLAVYWRWYRWRLRRLRMAPLPCPTCTQTMQLLDEADELPYLDNGQQSEQNIHSVDYDAWMCANQHFLPLGYVNPASPALPCPACHYRTLLFQKLDTVKRTSTTAAGWGWSVSECCYCHHQVKEKKIIPRLLVQPGGSGGRQRSSSSWRDSSSSSSSSWGDTTSGGSSGGGGAGSSW